MFTKMRTFILDGVEMLMGFGKNVYTSLRLL